MSHLRLSISWPIAISLFCSSSSSSAGAKGVRATIAATLDMILFEFPFDFLGGFDDLVLTRGVEVVEGNGLILTMLSCDVESLAAVEIVLLILVEFDVEDSKLFCLS